VGDPPELLEYKVPVMSQYAVVLAYCGEVDKTVRGMNELRPFAIASSQWRREFENQERLIAAIATDRAPMGVRRRAHEPAKLSELSVGLRESRLPYSWEE
jgi:hypothetical protein